MNNMASPNYWNRQYRSCDLHIARKKDFIRRWIESHVTAVSPGSKSCLEIGCYPGRFLAVFGELGYQLYGIDLADDLPKLPAWLAENGYAVGQFWNQDFLDFSVPQKFDIVSSFGFIEHFTEWETVLHRHAEQVAPDGYLLIEAPNFVGRFQNWLHSRFDQDNYRRHHIPAMDISRWVALLENRGFEIIYSGYFGKFRFWTEPQARSRYQRLVLAGLRFIQPLLRMLLPSGRKSYAPFCGVIARKPA